MASVQPTEPKGEGRDLPSGLAGLALISTDFSVVRPEVRERVTRLLEMDMLLDTLEDRVRAVVWGNQANRKG